MSQNKQISRIKEKLFLAKKKDKKKKVFGADSHKYKFKNPLSLDEVEAFEKKYNITLPKGYRDFIMQIGNEGKSHPNYMHDKSVAGPDYGIFPLERNNDIFLNNPLEYLQKPFKLADIDDKKWEEIIKNLPDDDEAYDKAMNELFAGILPIGTKGCTGVNALILNGKHKGKVIYLDEDLHKPFFTNTCFLDWYENWLDEILQDEEFEQKLISKLTSNDEKEILQAINSLHKFDKLKNRDAFLDLLNHQNFKIRDNALFLLTKYNYEKAKPVLSDILQNGNEQETLTALKSIHWYIKDKNKLQTFTDSILNCLYGTKSIELFDFGLYILQNAKADMDDFLHKLVKSEDDETRRTAYYNIGLLEDNSTFEDTLKNALSFEDKFTSIEVLQAIGKLNNQSFIKHYKAILRRIPNDTYIISNIIELLRELGLDSFDDEIKEYLKNYFDSIEDDSDYELSNFLITLKNIPLPDLLEYATKHKDKEISKQAKNYLKEL